MLIFPRNYFEKEERDGFLVDSDTKHAWAAQLDVLKVIEEICIRHKLKYFAAYGSLLGAIRHNGFIPWDDDIDIAMLRDDYEKLLEIAPTEVPAGYVVRNMHTMLDSDSYISRIANSGCINANQGFLLKSQGCPYAAGVDIFPIDSVPADEKIKKAKDDIIKLVFDLAGLITNIPEKDKKNKSLQLGLNAIEHEFDFEFDRNETLSNQILCLFDFIASSYSSSEGSIVANYINYIEHSKAYIFNKLWFYETVDLSFENVTIKAPIGFEAVVNICYGNNFMTPVKFKTHGSPFADMKNQLIEAGLYEKVLSARKVFLDVMCSDAEIIPPDDLKTPVPYELIEASAGRKTVLYALNSASILRYGSNFIKKVDNTVKIFESSKDNICMILAEDVTFLATLKDMYPECFDKYMILRQNIAEHGIGIVADSLYYDFAQMCDAYYGDGTSVIGEFIKTGKPVMLQNYDLI